ncbi:Outer membrane porin F [Zhongshania aliphaticivorans]|uniref:Outer membrane porin F n=1 Tax=Zhongshania aliphaticivorans TaxID=1470434 RepID=A0A5S9MQY3_9GAMM|nr:OmpA family protein [Zhongshania aliphaticivorans]CAA0078256.1 Outer membrane porin F [Zhongshania aliphaticivorans]CAA0086764.1 Outer membrane porin F [Zhongshania aliphaticivorans]
MKKTKYGFMIALGILALVPFSVSANGVCQAPTANAALELDGCKSGDTLILREVHFDTDSARIKETSFDFLSQVASELKQNPTIKVAVQGHTDSIGAADYNMSLSQNRAQSVRYYLVSAGVNPDQLMAQGFGLTEPLADNATSQGRAVNRRVELKMVGTLVLSEPVATNVYISTFHAVPSKLVVPAGSQVTWTNYDEISHDISFDGVDGTRIWTQGWKANTYSLQFDNPGTYTYRCSVHKDANGTIVVEPAVSEYVVTESPVYPGQTTSSYKGDQTITRVGS